MITLQRRLLPDALEQSVSINLSESRRWKIQQVCGALGIALTITKHEVVILALARCIQVILVSLGYEVAIEDHVLPFRSNHN